MEIRDEIPSLFMMCQKNDTGAAAPALVEKSQPRVPHHGYPEGAELGIPRDSAEIRGFYPKISTPESDNSKMELKPVPGPCVFHCCGRAGMVGWGLPGQIPLLGMPAEITMEHSWCHKKVIN